MIMDMTRTTKSPEAAKTAKTVKTPRVSLRRCVGCREMLDKKTLLRVVRVLPAETAKERKNPEFKLDLTGKANGRGAYICNNRICFEKAVKTGGFERSFKTKIPADIYEVIKSQLLEG